MQKIEGQGHYIPPPSQSIILGTVKRFIQHRKRTIITVDPNKELYQSKNWNNQ